MSTYTALNAHAAGMYAIRSDTVTENDMQNAIEQAISPEMIEKLSKLASDIGNAFAESIEVVAKQVQDAIAPICEMLADFIATVKDILAEDAKPRTIPPRYPVLSIGGRTNTSSKHPQIIRRGCRHK